MFVRTQKDYNQNHIKETDLCAHCGKKLYAPPVVLAYSKGYHAKCALQLAYALLYSFTGEPDMKPIQRINPEESPLFHPSVH
jgi:hypothetical protein